MDAKQKNMVKIGGALVALVVAVLAYFLFVKMQEMNEAEEAREQNLSTLRTAYAARAKQDKKTGEWSGEYPSRANLQVRKDDAAAYTEIADAAQELFTHELDYPHGETPPQFSIRLGNTVSELNARQVATPAAATAARDTTAQDTACTYSFARYIVNKDMPAEANVPRLAKQLAVIEYVSRMLLDNGALSITAVTRQEFDKVQAAPAQTSRRSSRSKAKEAPKEAGATEVDKVLVKDGMTCESYSITFTARYNTVATVLNQLSSGKLFVVITDLSMRNPADLMKRQATLIETRVNAKKKAASMRRGETTETVVDTTDLFTDASPADRLLSDPAAYIPLEVTLKFDVYSMPPAEVEESVESATKGN